MSTRQYIGARYVPKFADPITWDNIREYEALTIVTYLGTSYTSKKPVPAGTDISNTEYWVATGNYNEQVEEYRQEVEELANKFPVTSDSISNGAVTTNKLSNDAVKDVTLSDNNIMVFGDSWTAHATQELVDYCWVNTVAKALGNATIKVLAKAGAKMSTSSGNADSLYSQVQQAMNEISEGDRYKYKYAFVLGGVNDLNDTTISAENFRTGVRTAFTLLTENFPNTQVIFIPLNLFYTRVGNNSRYKEFSWNAINAVNGLPVTCMMGLGSFFRSFGQAVYRPNDDSSYTDGGGTYHPNKQGNEKIAQWILANMFGGGSRSHMFPVPFTIVDSTNFEILANNTQTDGNFVYWDMKVRIKQVCPTGFHNVALAKWDNYPRILADKSNDSGGNNIVCYPVGTAMNTNVVATKGITVFAPDFGETASLVIYTGDTFTNFCDVVIIGTTAIMDA